MERFFDLSHLALLATFLVLFVGRTIQLRVGQGIRVISLVRGKPWPEAVLGALFVVALPLWVVDIVWHAWPAAQRLLPVAVDPVVFDPGWVKALGLPLELLGIVLFAWALLSFGSSWRVGVDRDRPGELVTTGIFALSRNPIFLAMDLFLLGSVLLTGRLFPLLFALGTIVGFHFQILNEERFLEARYGTAYRHYRSRVRRYLGRYRCRQESCGSLPTNAR